MYALCRCCLDTMRLVDLLLVLLFEGRKALPKAGTSTISSRLSGLRRSDSAGDRSHRQLIDCIRSKDTDALIDAIDNGKQVNCIELIAISVCVKAYEVNCLSLIPEECQILF